MLTSDRHGGLSAEPWPDRIINYDGEFVRFRSIIPGSEVHRKKERKRIIARENRAFVAIALSSRWPLNLFARGNQDTKLRI